MSADTLIECQQTANLKSAAQLLAAEAEAARDVVYATGK